MNTVTEVREQLLELSRAGDALRGRDWSLIQAWHADVVAYVRATLGALDADDVANRLRVSRGSTQAEKEANAVGFVTDWIGAQVVGLKQEQLVAVVVVNSPGGPAVDGATIHSELKEEGENGDIGQAAGPADDSAGHETEGSGAAEVGGGGPAEPEPADDSENLE